MKNSTLVRIKVPKALYESALRKALLEAGDKEHKGGHKGNKFAKEDDYSKKAKVAKPTPKHTDKEPKKGGGAHKGKAFVKDDAYTNKVSAKKSLGETKKKMKEATQIEKFRTLTPNREIVKDASRMQEKKEKLKEVDENTLGAILGLLPVVGLSAAYIKDVIKKMKAQGLKGVKGFKQAAGEVGTSAKQHMDKTIGGNAPGQGHGVQTGKFEERKHKIKETKKHDDTAEDTKLIKKLVAPSALKAAGSKHPDEKADVTLMHKKLKPSAFKGSK